MKLTKFLIFMVCLFLITGCETNPEDEILESPSIATYAQFYKPSITLANGGREKVMLTLDTENAVLKNAKWTSSNRTVANVDSLGVVTALATGETTISLVADNNISGSCKVTVIESPVKNIVMPEAKYPLAKDALVFILGNGFTSNSKVILRPHTDFKPGLKSANNDDILVKINKITLNDLSLYLNVNPGFYNLILIENGKEYDLGNIEVQIPNIPEYVYDRNKIFWEDTHWRWFQLRGKAKEVNINIKKWSMSNRKSEPYVNNFTLYSFNKNGRLISRCDDNPRYHQKFEDLYEYDSQNRLVKCIYITNGEAGSPTEFYYGSHNFYVNIGNIIPLLPPEDFDFNNYSYRDCWVKGITGIKSSYWYGQTGEITFKIGNNSINTELKNSDHISTETYLYNSNNHFPYSYEYTYTSSNWNTNYTTDYKFSAIGVPISIISSNGEYLTSIENSPFYLLTERFDIYLDGSSDDFHYKHDSNWNLSEINYLGSDAFNHYYYTSYDNNGNWTECIYFEGDSGGEYGVTKLVRDITYW